MSQGNLRRFIRIVGGSAQNRSLETEDVISDTAKVFENLSLSQNHKLWFQLFCESAISMVHLHQDTFPNIAFANAHRISQEDNLIGTNPNR